MRECGSAGVRECGSAGVWECGSAGVRECGSAGVRECGSVEVREQIFKHWILVAGILESSPRSPMLSDVNRGNSCI